MRPKLLAAVMAALLLPCTALAGPEGLFHVKGANPDDGQEYTGTVKVTRKGDVYRVVWKIGTDETVGIGLGLRLVDGQMVAGAATDADTGIAVSYASGDTPGSATYTEFADGTWRGVWAYKGDKTVSTEEWVPTVRPTSAKTATAHEPKVEAAGKDPADARIEQAKADETKMEQTPIRALTSPLPTRASPKS